MGNDGRIKRVFLPEKVEYFEMFAEWDKLPVSIAENKYQKFIEDNGPCVAVNCFHEYEVWKKEQRGN